MQGLNRHLLGDERWRELVVRADRLDQHGDVVIYSAMFVAFVSLPFFLSLFVCALIIFAGMLIASFMQGIIFYLRHKIKQRESEIEERIHKSRKLTARLG